MSAEKLDVSVADVKKLKHDFLNDINSLKLNLEALEMLRDDPQEFAVLLELMRDTVHLFQDRVEFTLQRMSSDCRTP